MRQYLKQLNDTYSYYKIDVIKIFTKCTIDGFSTE